MSRAGPSESKEKAKKAGKAIEVPESVRVLAANVRRFRLRLGLSQVALAAAAAIEYKHFQKIEGAAWPGVRLDTVERLAKALNVSMAELLAEEGMEVRRARMD